MKFLKSIAKYKKVFFSPAYDELTLFIVTVALFTLAIIDETFWDSLYALENPVAIMGGLIMVIIGGYVSCLHAFSKRPKYGIEKATLLSYAVIVNAYTAVVTFWHLLSTTDNFHWLFIFPTINAISAVILAWGWKNNQVDHQTAILDHDYDKKTIIIHGILALMILLISRYYYLNHWSISFSVCLAYITNLRQLLNWRKNLYEHITGTN